MNSASVVALDEEEKRGEAGEGFIKQFGAESKAFIY